MLKTTTHRKAAQTKRGERRAASDRSRAERMRSQAEELREHSELYRQRTESSRMRAELSRSAAEEARQLREDVRQTAEGLRARKHLECGQEPDTLEQVSPALRAAIRDEVRRAFAEWKATNPTAAEPTTPGGPLPPTGRR